MTSKKFSISIALLSLSFFGHGQFDFVEVSSDQGANLHATANNAVAFFDIDGDEDEDLLISGVDGLTEISNLYINENGTFTLVENTPFFGTVGGAVDFSDIDEDGDFDVVIAGNSQNSMVGLYLNDGGQFASVADNPFSDLSSNTVLFQDIDGDGDEDLLIAGESPPGSAFSNLYRNEGGSFILNETSALEAASRSAASFSDIDGDGDPDLILSGNDGSPSEAFTNLYLNENGIYTEVTESNIIALWGASMDLSDVDNDGDQDLFISGQSTEGAVSTIYLNSGGEFVVDESNFFEGVSFGDVRFGDLDGDGDEDLIISGVNDLLEDKTFFYSNEDGEFTLIENVPFSNLSQSTIDYSDIDNDGDLDILLTGVSIIFPEVNLYLNNTPQVLTSLSGRKPNTLEIYPNPISDIARIWLPEIQDNAQTLTILNLDGRIVHQESVNPQRESISIDLTNLPTGFYILFLAGHDKLWKTKIMKVE